jgi:hypothetical protein
MAMATMARVLSGLALGSAAAFALAAEPTADPAALELFEKKIRPVLQETCFKCHGGEKVKNNLRVDSRESLLKGGDTGPAIVPGKPEASLLIKAIEYHDADLQMPPKKKLDDAVIADFVAWIKAGAVDPRVAKPAAEPAAAAPPGIDFEKGRRFWSFKPVAKAPPPPVKHAAWTKGSVDQFVLAKLEAAGLEPAPAASKRTLIRRAYFDLIGLPPSPAEVEAFLADNSPAAFAAVVDRLLKSPQYGQRWARHWLDIVRYTDSVDSRALGKPGDDTVDAWRYRDWVVDAFNSDLPYNQFVMKQVAGDLIAAKSGDARDIVPTAVLAIGDWGTGDSDKRKMMTDIVDDQIDLVSRGFLGLTMACARCHDHKFDPISTEDYYAMAGFFFSSHILPDPGNPTMGSLMIRIPLLTAAQEAERKKAETRIAELDKQIAAAADQAGDELVKQWSARSGEYIMAAWDARPGAEGKATVESLAAERKLDPDVVRLWAGLLGAGGSVDAELAGLFREKIQDPKSKAITGWGFVATPVLTVNSSDQPLTVTTQTLAAHSVAIHPSVTQAAAIGWRSPIAGKVRVTGRVFDEDTSCGNGFAWTVEVVRALGGKQRLAGGAVDNGGQMKFPDDPALAAVDVAVGDMISVLVDARNGDYSCDTTGVDFTVAELGGKRAWDVAHDVSSDVTAGNPHADTLGNPGVWQFYATNAPKNGGVVPPGSALAKFVEAAGQKAPREQLQALATDVQKIVTAPAAPAGDAPNTALYNDVTKHGGGFWKGLDFAIRTGPQQKPLIEPLKSERDTLAKQVAEPPAFTEGIAEGGVPNSEHIGFHDAHIHIRGRYDRLGPIAKRGFPRVIAGDDQPGAIEGSGRLLLAEWLVKPSNPLTARVAVNRVWQHLFGHGIAATSGNFGKQGDPPTHPELLDYLAQRFIDSGWSVKQIQREIMLSAAYQQSSTAARKTLEADPENKLLGRMNRRRLESEAIRDSLLSAAGRIDLSPGGPAVDENSPRRALYVRTIRSDKSGFRNLFDAPDPTAIVTQRNESTVAPQGLFMINNPLVLEQVAALEARLEREGPADVAGRIDLLYRWLYGRPAEAREKTVGATFLNPLIAAGNAAATQQGWRDYCHLLLCANEFVYID